MLQPSAAICACCAALRLHATMHSTGEGAGAALHGASATAPLPALIKTASITKWRKKRDRGLVLHKRDLRQRIWVHWQHKLCKLCFTDMQQNYGTLFV